MSRNKKDFDVCIINILFMWEDDSKSVDQLIHIGPQKEREMIDIYAYRQVLCTLQYIPT